MGRDAQELAQTLMTIGSMVGMFYGGYKGFSLYHQKTPPEARQWYLSVMSGLGGMALGRLVGLLVGAVAGASIATVL